MADPKEEAERVAGPHGEAFVLPPDKRGMRKVPRGHEQYHGFWRVVYYPSSRELLSAPEVLRTKDEDEADEVAHRVVDEGIDAVHKWRYA